MKSFTGTTKQLVHLRKLGAWRRSGLGVLVYIDHKLRDAILPFATCVIRKKCRKGKIRPSSAHAKWGHDDLPNRASINDSYSIFRLPERYAHPGLQLGGPTQDLQERSSALEREHTQPSAGAEGVDIFFLSFGVKKYVLYRC